MIKNGLMKQVRQEIEEEQHQEALRKQHGIEDENVVVVEKKSMMKFLIRLFIGFIKTIASIAGIILAGTGIMTLIYPDVRNEFIAVLLAVIDDVIRMTGL